MRTKTEFQIYKKTHRSGRVSFQVNAGKINGRRHLPAFPTRDAAEHYRAKLIERDALASPAALSDLTTLAAANVRLALERLKPFDASILEAVDFYIRFAKPTKGKITIKEAITAFEKSCKRRGLSTAYITKSRALFSQFRDAVSNCLMSDVTTQKASDYIYGNKGWKASSKNTHIRHLRALYASTIKAGHCTLNPFQGVDFVKETGVSAGSKVLTVADTITLLDHALTEGNQEGCATLVLVLFCGVRIEEAGRIKWDQISLNGKKPHVRIEEAKNNRRRVNDIPENAVLWLEACSGTGTVAPPNFAKAMQRLRKTSGVTYKQNAARHSFASYHVALNNDAAKTAMLLGHPNPTLLYSTYRECVGHAEAMEYFDIVPPAERKRRKLEKAKKEAAKSTSKSKILSRLKTSGKRLPV